MEPDGHFIGIATDDPDVDVVWTEYDELKIRYHDALLIAAAPDLLAALKRALDWLASYPGGNATGTYRQACAAIAKAEGR